MSSPGLKGHSPKKQIELYSGTYFGACALGGVIGKKLDSRILTAFLSGSVFLLTLSSFSKLVAQPTHQ